MKVVVALDGSVHSHAALEALVRRNWPDGTRVKLVAVSEPGEGIESPAPARAAGKTGGGSLAHVDLTQRFLSDLARDIACELPGVAVEHEILAGRAKDVLVDVLHEWSADLVILGSRGRTGLDLMLLGSVSQSVLNSAPCPVHIAKWGDNACDGTGKVTNVLVPVDHSQHSSAALEWLLEQSWTGEIKFTLLTVVKPIQAEFANQYSTEKASRMLSAWQRGKDAALSLLLEWGERLESRFGRNSVECHIADGNPQDAIVRIAGQLPAHLIVMGSHGRGGLTALVLGSVSQAVSLHSPCSVEIVRGRSSKLHAAVTERFLKRKRAQSESHWIACQPRPSRPLPDRQARPPLIHSGF